MNRVEAIRSVLNSTLEPEQLEIIDDSHKHAGHASAGGAGHFTVRVVSPVFAGKSLIERHRLVYAALDDLMHSEIHALSIKAETPEESKNQ
ncbi:BolA family protein [Thiohalomonas denitrificans]|uniref:BolA protein n=1 Tax=Thiohalomonas denitrificans TaxID=415747 RepID=A0A1G5PIJ3_9GAMM|nr:BolA family protein [Thiohalomonas denitrificans]SCZ49307.1 BolA protein [Thiohalomonas denitrificans]